MIDLKRGKPHRAFKTWLQSGLLTGCALFAPLANALSVPNAPDNIDWDDKGGLGLFLFADVDLRNNESTSFNVVDTWDWNHQLNLTITYDRYTDENNDGDPDFYPPTLDSDVLTSLDIIITGAAANVMELNLQKGFKVPLPQQGAKGVVLSGNNGDGFFIDGVADDDSDDQRIFTLALSGDPLYRGDIWRMEFGGVWSDAGGLDLDYGVTIVPHVVSSANMPLPGAVWLFGSGLVGLLGWGRMRNRG